jgi:hypothetical protein
MMLELSDAVSMFENGMQTLTEEIVRTGTISNTGIKFEFLEGERVLCSCKVDSSTTNLLLTPESSLGQGETRDSFPFLFETMDGAAGKWKLVDILSKDDIDYSLTNSFHDSYSENPLRDYTERNGLEAKLDLYFSKNGDTGLAIFEIGHNLKNKSGLLYLYTFREIPESEKKYI